MHYTNGQHTQKQKRVSPRKFLMAESWATRLDLIPPGKLGGTLLPTITLMKLHPTVQPSPNACDKQPPLNMAESTGKHGSGHFPSLGPRPKNIVSQSISPWLAASESLGFIKSAHSWALLPETLMQWFCSGALKSAFLNLIFLITWDIQSTKAKTMRSLASILVHSTLFSSFSYR